MSSILKALKKLEEETEIKEESAGWIDPVQTKRDAASYDRKGLKIKLAVFISIIAVCFILGFREMRRLSTQLSAAPPPAQELNKKTPRHPEPKEEAAPLAITTASMAADALEPSKPAVESVSPAPEPIKPIPEPEKVANTLPMIPKESNSLPVAATETGKKPGNQAMVEERTQPVKTEPVQMEDARLTLQAIVWSEKPSDRFAIVNERIVREGDAVDGISILLIEKSAIRFKEGTKEWSQTFRGQ